MVHEHGFNAIHQIPYAKFSSGQIRHFPHKFAVHHFQLFPKFLTKLALLFIKIFRSIKKHGIVLLVSVHQYCHTESF